MATTYRNLEIKYRVEGPKERDGMVCATDWFSSLAEALNRSKTFPEGIDREKCIVVKRVIRTTIEKFPYYLASCPKCIG